MRCEECRMELVALQTLNSLAYWCRSCHTLELIGRDGKSLGIVNA